MKLDLSEISPALTRKLSRLPLSVLAVRGCVVLSDDY